MVAMATAVSGTGPTYVFLVMEALIDAAVHLGFPRHIAHDLVIETLEGSTLFAKQSGMHPAELRNMVTSPGGTSAAALHELDPGGCGRSCPKRSGPRSGGPSSSAISSRRASARPPDATDRGSMATRRRRARDAAPTIAPTCDGRPRRPPRRSTCAQPDATSGRTRRRSGTALPRTWAGLDEAAWHLPGRRRRTRAGRTGRSPSTSATSRTGRSSRSTTRARAWRPGDWPTDDDYDGGDFDRFNERRREPWTTMPRASISAGSGGAPAAPRGRPAPRARSDPSRRLGLGLQHPPRPLSRPPRGHRAVGRRAPGPPGRRRPVHRRPAAARPRRVRGPGRGHRAPTSMGSIRPLPPRSLDDAERHARLGPCATTSPISPIGRTRAPGRSRCSAARALAGRSRGGDRCVERADGRAVTRHGVAATLARYDAARSALLEAIGRPVNVEELRSPDGWSWAYDCLHGHVRKHLAMLGPWCASRLADGRSPLMATAPTTPSPA